MSIKASGVEPGQRQLNGIQTTGREYRSLSQPEFGIKRTNDVVVTMRDGTTNMATNIANIPNGSGFLFLLASGKWRDTS